MPASSRGRFQEPTATMLLADAERIAMAGRFASVAHHRHATAAVVVGLDGPLGFVAGRRHDSRAVLIAPGLAHAVDTRGGRLAMFVLPPHALAAATTPPLRDLPNPGGWLELGAAVAAGRLGDFAAVEHEIGRLGLRPIDDRVRRALDALIANLEDNLNVAALADQAGLSPSRLMGLVRAQLGTSLRVYRRWLRAFRVARDYAAGASLTEAALAAGFASSAHLSAAAREHFGIRPSDILTPHNRAALRRL